MDEQRTQATQLLPFRLGIATLISANDQNPCARSYGCALRPWCASARRLSAALSERFVAVSLLGVHAARNRTRFHEAATPLSPSHNCLLSHATEVFDGADCPELIQIHPSAEMLQASRQHAKRVIRSGVMSYDPKYISRGYVFLWKFELWRLRDFDAILHSDLDVDLSPPRLDLSRVADEWAQSIPAMVAKARRGELRQVGFRDASTPWNGGVSAWSNGPWARAVSAKYPLSAWPIGANTNSLASAELAAYGSRRPRLRFAHCGPLGVGVELGPPRSGMCVTLQPIEVRPKRSVPRPCSLQVCSGPFPRGTTASTGRASRCC